MPFDVDVKVFVQSLGPEAAALLAQAGEETKVEVETDQAARRGITPLTSIAVDGVLVDDFTTVKPESVVFEYWGYRREMIAAAYAELKARAPVLTGEYRDHFYAIADERAFDHLEVPTAHAIKDAARITITNDRPYSRRLEVGKTEGGEDFIKHADPHIIESVAKLLQNEFGTLVKISFGFVELAGGYHAKQSWTNMRQRKLGGSKQKAAKPMRYPSIFIDQV